MFLDKHTKESLESKKKKMNQQNCIFLHTDYMKKNKTNKTILLIITNHHPPPKKNCFCFGFVLHTSIIMWCKFVIIASQSDYDQKTHSSAKQIHYQVVICKKEITMHAIGKNHSYTTCLSLPQLHHNLLIVSHNPHEIIIVLIMRIHLAIEAF